MSKAIDTIAMRESPERFAARLRGFQEDYATINRRFAQLYTMAQESTVTLTIKDSVLQLPEHKPNETQSRLLELHKEEIRQLAKAYKLPSPA